MKFDLSRASQLLRTGSGRADAVFRDGQAEAIEHVVQGSGRLLVVQKTGLGQELCLFHRHQASARTGAGSSFADFASCCR
jgi:ATP-dependent DNA helicase RecQ